MVCKIEYCTCFCQVLLASRYVVFTCSCSTSRTTGPQFQLVYLIFNYKRSSFQLLGYFSNDHFEDHLCGNYPPDFVPKTEIAIARRGHCSFLQKTQVAQLAGFKGTKTADLKYLMARSDLHKSHAFTQ